MLIILKTAFSDSQQYSEIVSCLINFADDLFNHLISFASKINRDGYRFLVTCLHNNIIYWVVGPVMDIGGDTTCTMHDHKYKEKQ